MISYDKDGKMLEPEGFDEALQVLREGIAQRKGNSLFLLKGSRVWKFIWN